MQSIKLSDVSSKNIVKFLKEIFEQCGHLEYLGEQVTMSEHMRQSAFLAEKKGYKEDIVVAALLHDIGHFVSELGSFKINDEYDRLHEEAGAHFLEKYFPTIISDCVRFHVAAKRYLCAIKPEYLNTLSEASIHSLKLQGGPMNKIEVKKFNQNVNLDEIIKVRYLDDAGKLVGEDTPNFDYFAPMILRLVNSHNNN